MLPGTNTGSTLPLQNNYKQKYQFPYSSFSNAGDCLECPFSRTTGMASANTQAVPGGVHSYTDLETNV